MENRKWIINQLRDSPHGGMGDGYSRSVLEGQSPIFLQAMGRCREEESWAHTRRSHLPRMRCRSVWGW